MGAGSAIVGAAVVESGGGAVASGTGAGGGSCGGCLMPLPQETQASDMMPVARRVTAIVARVRIERKI